MTVRWKPLLILSGLFVVVALFGLMTIATVMGSRDRRHPRPRQGRARPGSMRRRSRLPEGLEARRPERLAPR